MMDSRPGLPWVKINDYLMELGSQRNIPDLLQKGIANLSDLIPYDISGNIFAGLGNCLEDNSSDRLKILSMYNQYYGFINPIHRFDVTGMKWLDWRDFQNSEFVADFIYPQGIRYSLASFIPGCSIAASIHRSRRSSVFQDRDFQIMRIITPHFNNIHSYLDKIAGLEITQLRVAELARGCKKLSKREAEIAALLCRRLSVPEIATKLLIGCRTVEFHIANIYDKLKVRNRRELILKLVGRRNS